MWTSRPRVADVVGWRIGRESQWRRFWAGIGVVWDVSGILAAPMATTGDDLRDRPSLETYPLPRRPGGLVPVPDATIAGEDAELGPTPRTVLCCADRLVLEDPQIRFVPTYRQPQPDVHTMPTLDLRGWAVREFAGSSRASSDTWQQGRSMLRGGGSSGRSMLRSGGPGRRHAARQL